MTKKMHKMSPHVFEINHTQKHMKSHQEFENKNCTQKQKYVFRHLKKLVIMMCCFTNKVRVIQ